MSDNILPDNIIRFITPSIDKLKELIKNEPDPNSEANFEVLNNLLTELNNLNKESKIDEKMQQIFTILHTVGVINLDIETNVEENIKKITQQLKIINRKPKHH